jgi:hypothetical protein
MKTIVKQIALTTVVVVAVVVYACGKSASVSVGSDAGLPTSTSIDASVAGIADEAGVVVPVASAEPPIVEKDGVRFGGPVCVPGTGTGQAQDATAQCIAAKYGLTTPVGGTGTGLCQDATLQAILGAIPSADAGANLPDGGKGAIWYENGGIVALPIGTTDQVLTVSSGLPAWNTGIDSTGALPIGGTSATSIAEGNSSTTASITNTVISGDTWSVVNGAAVVATLSAASGDQITLGAGTATETLTPSAVTFGKSVSAPTISVSTQTTDVAPPTLLFQAGAPWASAVTHVAPGPIVFNIPLPASGTAYGYTEFQNGGTPSGGLMAYPGIPSYGLFSLGNSVPSTSNYVLIGNGTTVSLNGSPVLLTTNATTQVSVSTTGVGLNQPLAGLGTNPFAWKGETSPNTVACSTGGTQTISAAQSIIPFFLVSAGVLTSNCTLDFSTNASTGSFHVSFGSPASPLVTATDLASFSLLIKNGTTSYTVTAAVLTALQATGKNGYVVDTYGTNNLTLE